MSVRCMAEGCEDLRFAEFNDLARHRKAGHPGSKLNPPQEPTMHRCPDCDFTGKTKQSLGAHRARAHGYRKAGATATLDPIVAAHARLLKARARVDAKITAVDELIAERDRLDKAIAALEGAAR